MSARPVPTIIERLQNMSIAQKVALVAVFLVFAASIVVFFLFERQIFARKKQPIINLFVTGEDMDNSRRITCIMILE
jgi:hypothetical protein